MGIIENSILPAYFMDPSKLIEEGLVSVAESIGEKIEKKWWSKFVYPMLIIAVLAVPIIYYFW